MLNSISFGNALSSSMVNKGAEYSESKQPLAIKGAIAGAKVGEAIPLAAKGAIAGAELGEKIPAAAKGVLAGAVAAELIKPEQSEEILNSLNDLKKDPLEKYDFVKNTVKQKAKDKIAEMEKGETVTVKDPNYKSNGIVAETPKNLKITKVGDDKYVVVISGKQDGVSYFNGIKEEKYVVTKEQLDAYIEDGKSMKKENPFICR